jgi:hypothetical protein
MLGSLQDILTDEDYFNRHRNGGLGLDLPHRLPIS